MVKKDWQKPNVEVLHVSQTFLSTSGTKLDADFSAGTLISEITAS